MKYISLTRGLVAIVDDDDFDRLNKHKWFAGGKGSFYAKRAYPRGSTIWMHREIIGDNTVYEVDHINHNTLDNRKENLRYVTRTQNRQNLSGSYSSSKTKVRGVCWKKQISKYVAQITVNKKKMHLGYFSTIEEAKTAYIEANKRYFKQHGGFYQNS